MFDVRDDDDDADDADLGVPAGQEPLTHEGLLICGWNRGEPIPALDRIAQERSRDVLRPLRHVTRQMAQGATQRGFVFASELVGELWLADGDARDRAVSAPPPAMPAGARPPRRRAHQMNFRLAPDEYDRLAEAAKLFAMSPTTLARVLTARGVDRALYEARRDS